MFRMIPEGRIGLIVPIVIHRAEGNHNGGGVEAMPLESALVVGEGWIGAPEVDAPERKAPPESLRINDSETVRKGNFAE